MKDHHVGSEDEDKNKGYFIVFILRNQPRKNIFLGVLSKFLYPTVKYLLVLIKLFKRNMGFNAQRDENCQVEYS